MTAPTTNAPSILADDGVPLKQKLARAERRQKLLFFGLSLPLLAFVTVTFVVPIGIMMKRSVHIPIAVETIPRTLDALRGWNGAEAPDEVLYATLADEIRAAGRSGAVGKLATQLNYVLPGSRSTVTRTARRLRRHDGNEFKEFMISVDARWGTPEIWAAVRNLDSRYSLFNYLTAFDHRYDQDGGYVPRPEQERIYVPLLVKTIAISLLITGICILLAYPISYQLANLPARKANLLMILVLLPFWTSLLVRTTSWIVLLQSQGTINDLLVWAGVLDDESRIQMIYNMFGTVVAMVHIMLPFMILPLYSVMAGIPPDYMRAAESLGATRNRAFATVYFPQTVPGLGAGSILVFILSIGYYITPALVGGRTGQFISNAIAYHMQQSLNWGLAAALGCVLLVCVLAMYWLYSRFVGIDNMRMG